MAHAALPLSGLNILNTRPAHQQADLRHRLETLGAAVLAFPVIEIVACEATAFHLSLAQNIAHYDIALFVSRNAVDGAFEFLPVASLPADLHFGVIGEGTHQALAARVDDLARRLIRSESFNSEGLLAAAELQQVQGRNILIFRGQQGRNLLGDELRARGARVSYCEVYRRKCPQIDTQGFTRLCAGRFPDLVILTSNEGMHNLLDLVDANARAKLLSSPWLLISERMRESAVKLGHNGPIIIATNASDEGIQRAISKWTCQQPV